MSTVYNNTALLVDARIGLRRVASARAELERIAALAELGFGGPTLDDLSEVVSILRSACLELRSLVEEGGAS